MELTRQQIRDRYSGALLGLFWSVLQPMLYLATIGFVFTVVFPRQWSTPSGDEVGKVGFALLVFIGLIVFWFFSEPVNRAPGLLRSNENYVKNVVFPIELLAWVNIGEAAFHACIRVALLVIGVSIAEGGIVLTSVFLPLVWLPLVLIILGGSWILARVGAFARDLEQIITVVMTAALFLSAVFYSADVIPQPYRDLFLLNPIAFTIEQSRRVLIWGLPPDWVRLFAFSVVGMFLVWFGWRVFTRARGRYADVL